MKKYHLYLLSLLSGVLLSFSWFPNGLLPLLFIAFIPLLMVENVISQHPQQYKVSLFLCSYLTFFTWNILTTWWLKNASIGGAVMAIFLNALIMAFFFSLFHRVKKRIGKWSGVLFICFWVGFEYIHINWDLSWSWLTIGNAFANVPDIVQWYEYTGVLGGSTWVLLINVLIFTLILNFKRYSSKIKMRFAALLLCLLIIPLIISFFVGRSATRFDEGSVKTVIIQPNIDPYNEKFFDSFEEQLVKMLSLAAPEVDSTTEYLIFPETALTESIWEESLGESRSLQILSDFLKKYPRLKIVAGATTLKSFSSSEELSETARKSGDGYYDIFNTAIQLDSSKTIQIYHKSKLVPGVETMPLQFIFKHFESLAIDLGGTVGSQGIQKERAVLASSDERMKAAPVICYESIFGEYVTEYVKNGANFIAIITNDGWWGDTPGYKQHLQYGRLRAIENRRWIARSANTGVSCFITPSGKILQATDYWVPAVIVGNIGLNNELTFYSKFGDYLGRIAMYTAFLLLIYSLLIRFNIIKKV
ncbi:MAG TPA: apolipoprotein N-acyltransferase [Bacteroidia bacterium]